jgi:ribosome-associated protein
VNKVNSKAVLHWNCAQSTAFPPEMLSRFLERFANRLTKDGTIVITSDRFRDQISNREDCLEKLRALLLQILHPPRSRKKTRPKRSSVVKGKENKKRNSEKKKNRSRVRE